MYIRRLRVGELSDPASKADTIPKRLTFHSVQTPRIKLTINKIKR